MDIDTASLGTPSLWDLIHAESGIPSHGRAYATALSYSGIEPHLCRVRSSDGGIVIPYYVRSWYRSLDICTWLSVSGACLWGNPARSLQRFRSHAQRNGWVAGYLQTEPESLLPSGPEAASGNKVFLLNLEEPDPLAQASQIVRRKVSRTESSGAFLVEDREVLAEALVSLYPVLIARTGAAGVYNLPPACLRELAASPEVLILGASVDRTIEAVMVFPCTGHRSEFFLGASTALGRDLSTWLLARSFLKLQSAGIRQLNLGGGVRSGDGLYDFKKRFGGQEIALGKLLHIYDPVAYHRCCDDAGVSTTLGWFPAYRAAR